MFRCTLCRRQVPARTPPHRVVLESREKEYRYRVKANMLIRLDAKRKRNKLYRDDPGGVGREIVREVPVCQACAAGNGEA